MLGEHRQRARKCQVTGGRPPLVGTTEPTRAVETELVFRSCETSPGDSQKNMEDAALRGLEVLILKVGSRTSVDIWMHR